MLSNWFRKLILRYRGASVLFLCRAVLLSAFRQTSFTKLQELVMESCSFYQLQEQMHLARAADMPSPIYQSSFNQLLGQLYSVTGAAFPAAGTDSRSSKSSFT
jgi:hypothetical protein